MSNVSRIPTPRSLYEQWIADQGLTASDVAAMQLALVDPVDVAPTLGFNPDAYSVFIPYAPAGSPGYIRVRRLGVKDNKYMSPKGSGCAPPYLPPVAGYDWMDIKADPSRPVAIAEGEVKSYWGSKMGFPTVGIGGVDMQETLFDGSWIWRGRIVCIAFDHDLGQDPGQYKPGVALALGKLCSSLVERGADVKVLGLGWVNPTPSQKCGLDDYLRAGGEWKALIATEQPPPEWCSELAAMLDECVYVTGTNHVHVYNLKNGSRKSPADFHDTHIEKKREVRGEGGKPKVKPISRIWIEHPGRVTVGGYTMDPRQSFGVRDGSINLWRGYPTWPQGREGVGEQWQRFMEGLFGEHWKWVGLWTGHMLNRPWEPTNQAVMLTTRVQGIGKSLYGDIVRDLCGVHGLECSAGRMFDKFNSAMEGKTFIVVNELDIKFSAKEGAMNDLLSAETVTVEQKGKDTIELPNLRRWYTTTNASSPCRLSAGQRRVLVVAPPRVEGDTRGEWGTWVRETVAGYRRDGQAMGAIREWFDSLWWSSGEGEGVWNPTKPVERTAEGDELAELTMTNTQVIAEELWRMGKEDENGGVLCAAPMTRAQHRAIFLELTAIVKARGGFVGQKKVRDSGRELYYSVYDLSGSLNRIDKTDGGHRIEVETAVAKASAERVALKVADLDRILTGKG